MKHLIRRVVAASAVAALALSVLAFTAAPAQAAGESVSLSGQYCKDDGSAQFTPTYVLDVYAGDTDYVFTAYFGNDVLAPWHQQQFAVPANTFQQVVLDFGFLTAGQYFFIWPSASSPTYFSQDDHQPGELSTKFVLDCSYDPLRVGVSYQTPPQCVNGAYDDYAEVQSLNNVRGESITIKIDGQNTSVVDEPVDPMDTRTFSGVIPANSPPGEHTYTLYNRGEELFTYDYTITEPCVVVSPSDFIVAVGTRTVNPGGATVNTQVSVTSTSDASRQSVFWFDGLFADFPIVPANGEVTVNLTGPVCEETPLQVSLGFPELAYDEVLPAFGCEEEAPKANIGVTLGLNSLETDVEVENVGTVPFQFVVFAYSENGARVDKTPSPGDTSFSLAPGESVTFHATVEPLPAGDGFYFFQLLPVFGEGVIATSDPITYVPPVLNPPVLVSGPTLTGTAKVGSTLTCNVSYTGADTVNFGWLRDGVLTSLTGPTRTLTGASDYGHTLACVTTASNADGTTATSTSASSAVVAVGPALKVVTKPRITGTSTVGRTLTARNGTWSPSGTSFTYQWYVNGVAKPGATGKTYTLKRADDNKRIRVLVTAYRTGYGNGVFKTPYVVV